MVLEFNSFQLEEEISLPYFKHKYEEIIHLWQNKKRIMDFKEFKFIYFEYIFY